MIKAVTLEGWPGLEVGVQIELEPTKTVLVGKNGAGKSAILSAMVEGALIASMGSKRVAHPYPEFTSRSFTCEFVASDNVEYTYEYRQAIGVVEADSDASETTGSRALTSIWWERCTAAGASAPLWQVKDGAAQVAGHGDEILVPPGVSLLSLAAPQLRSVPVFIELDTLLSGFDLVGAGVPRPFGAKRKEIYLNANTQRRGKTAIVRWTTSDDDAASSLAVRLANLHERDEEGFAELNAVLRRLSLAEQITFHKYSLSGPGEAEDFGIVAFDGVNIGHLSDGTLRVTEMLVHLLRRHLTVLCVEEPETAVHPGLLQGVLAELESYGLDRQVVVSTHSPNVVNWFAPREVRLVERTGGDTEVRRISDLEMPQVEAYLNNEGLLDGYLFNREE